MAEETTYTERLEGYLKMILEYPPASVIKESVGGDEEEFIGELSANYEGIIFIAKSALKKQSNKPNKS